VSLTQPTTQTLRIATTIKNFSTSEVLQRCRFAHFNLRFPGPSKQFSGGYPLLVNEYDGHPARILSGDWGSVAFWQEGYPTNAVLGTGYGSANQTDFPLRLRSYWVRHESKKSVVYDTPILPGEERTFTLVIRFGETDETLETLAAEAYEEYRKAYPFLLEKWTDRRPIGNWFIAEGTKRSATNPRGYLQDASLDARDPAVLRRRVMSTVDGMIERMRRMRPVPQGLIIWDLEGQEFSHTFTYVGDPTRLPELAPEMDGVADELFRRFKEAGFKVGVTIRPSEFQTGHTLPEKCETNEVYDLQDKFILNGGPFRHRGFVCSATDTWTPGGPNGPYNQKTLSDDDAIFENLAAKLRYANERWGAQLFYIDSNVYPFGNTVSHKIFRRLMERFPDVLLIPEWETHQYFGSSAPYNQANMNVGSTSAFYKTTYPDAFSLINVADADFPKMNSSLLSAVRGGDIFLFRAWFDSPEIQRIQTLFQQVGMETRRSR
jgi:hypothetical protein